MSTKIDVTEEAHEAIRAHCKMLKISVKAWASHILTAAADRRIPPPVRSLETVKPITQLREQEPTDVYTRPPFWETDILGDVPA